MRALSLCALAVLVGWSWACDTGDGTQTSDGGRDGAADGAPAAGDAGDAGAADAGAVTDAPAEAIGPGDSGIADQTAGRRSGAGRPAAGRKLDILFVVDNSGSMAQEQANLARNFPVLMQELVSAGADLHIAVVSSDLGAGAGPVGQGCPQTGGDRGVFCRRGRPGFLRPLRGGHLRRPVPAHRHPELPGQHRRRVHLHGHGSAPSAAASSTRWAR